jgi:hypothetical protein
MPSGLESGQPSAHESLVSPESFGWLYAFQRLTAELILFLHLLEARLTGHQYTDH